MGMDISGLKPTSAVGEYHRFNIFSWPQYAAYMQHIAPELFRKIESPWTNDGSGLNAADAKLMGEKILASINTETMVKYLESIPEQYTVYTNGVGSSPSKMFDPERMRGFANFLIASGGFEIW